MDHIFVSEQWHIKHPLGMLQCHYAVTVPAVEFFHVRCNYPAIHLYVIKPLQKFQCQRKITFIIFLSILCDKE